MRVISRDAYHLETLSHVLQDTITGFLLAGVGNVDMRKKKNFLVVDSSKYLPTNFIFSHPTFSSCITFLHIIAMLGLWVVNHITLIRVSDVSPAETPTRLIEETFKEFTVREEIAVVLISQYVRTGSLPFKENPN